MVAIVLKAGALRSSWVASGYIWLQPTATRLQPGNRCGEGPEIDTLAS